MLRYSLRSRFLLVLWAAYCALLPSSAGWASARPYNPLYPTGAASAVTYDDTGDTIRLESPYYALVFRKVDGSIFYITDKFTGQHVTEGSRGQCLWWATSRGGSNAGGCSWAGGYQFSYHWTPSAGGLPGKLVFHYTSAASNGVEGLIAAPQLAVTVTTVPTGDRWFDMQMDIVNSWGDVLNYVKFPSDLLFNEKDIQGAYLPILPGVVLNNGFFTQVRRQSPTVIIPNTYIVPYPGYGVFADYVDIRFSKGNLAIYSLSEQGPLHPLDLGFTDDNGTIGSTYYNHTYRADTPSGQAWHSPVVRLQIGGGPDQTIADFAAASGLNDFPTLREKLGAGYDQVVRSPLYKADLDQLQKAYANLCMTLLSKVPVAGLFHPVAYWPGGFDENYPDFLPPNPRWGSASDFSNMLTCARRMGFLNIPYTNPTWWDNESPTLKDPEAPPDDKIAVLDENGQPVYECYPDPYPLPCNPTTASRGSGSGFSGGYVVSPSTTFVRDRLALLMTQLKAYPFDLIFEDQIGARPWRDAAPTVPDPADYFTSWIDHTRLYQNRLLMTERGYDRLMETEIGFHGSVLMDDRSEAADTWWGKGSWQYYPLIPMIARNKVLLYQHDLDPATMTADKATFTWNLAFGYMLSYDLYSGMDNPWLKIDGAFQQRVLSTYADENLLHYSLAGSVSRSEFTSTTATANWDTAHPYSSGGFTLPPLGVMISGKTGDLTAGVFTTYNGVPLSPGDHFIIEERGPSAVTVSQPSGADTDLLVRLVPTWSAASRLEAWAFTSGNQYIGKVYPPLAAGGVTLHYQAQLNGKNVDHYVIVKASRAYLPVACSR